MIWAVQMAKQADPFLDTQPDAVLWSASQKGDEAALRALIARHSLAAEQLCGGFQAAGMEREDLLQEAYIGLLKAVRSYQLQKDVPFDRFALLCMKRQLISAVPRPKKKKHQPRNESVPLEASGEWTHLLSPLEKQTLQLYVSGFSYEEMAKKLSCSEKKVDNALQRIRRKLRNL